MITHSKLKDVIVCKQQKVGEAADNPYLSLHRLHLQNDYHDGTKSAIYPYDAVLRKWLDAVVIILFTRMDHKYSICLRSSIRPPLLLRGQCPIPIPEQKSLHYLWELPAGLLEDTDKGEEGIRHRAHLETLEETGYHVPPDQINRMKCAPFVSAGVIPERMWYTFAEVSNPSCQKKPQGDGSPIEENATIQWVGLESALSMCEDGRIDDMKTELGIRRIASYLQAME